jgi:hypothetical protein
MIQQILTILLSLPCAWSYGQMIPTNFLAPGAISSDYNGNGCSFVDFNLDGWDDATFATPNGVFFFENDQNGQLIEVDLGIFNIGNARHPMWVDIDNDGDLDFFTTNCSSPNRIWVNDGPNGFVEFSETSGLMQTDFWESHGASWGDYDGDGLLDLYITNYDIQGLTTNYLYRNNGDLTFTNMNATCNCSNGVQNSFQSLWMDYNEDGLLDLAVINDRIDNPNTIYENQGDGTFNNVGPNLNFNQSIFAMSLSMSDFENDDDDDFYISNDTNGNLLLRFEDGSFQNVAPNLGVAVNEVCWGAQWFDYDNDRDEDLFVATYSGNENTPNAFFSNTNGTFNSLPENIGNSDSDVHASGAGDLNNDGFTDLLLHTFAPHFQVLVNQPNENNWLKVRLEGTVSNTFGVGSAIRMYTGSQFQKRFVHCGEDYMGQDSYTEMFGLGSSEMVDSIKITWPSGWIDTFYDLPSNQVLTAVEGVSFDPEIVISGSLCSNETNLLTVTGEELVSYEWDNETTESSLSITNSGIYTVIAANEFNLIDTISIEVLLTESPDPQVNTTNVTCADGNDAMIELFNVSGIVVETVDWNEGAYSGEAIFGLPAGEYIFLMTDVNGCVDSDTVLITQPEPIVTNLEFESPLCFNQFGFAEVNPIGGSGIYEVLWSAADNMNLPDGDFEVEVIDDSGCSAVTPFTIAVPTEIIGTLTIENAIDGDNGSASINVQGGTPDYLIQWSNADLGEEANDLGQGAYVVFVTDANGCTWSESFSIIDTGIDELQNEITIATMGPGQFELTLSIPTVSMRLIDAMGRLIDTDHSSQMSYTINLENAPTGIYFVILTFQDGNESRIRLMNVK